MARESVSSSPIVRLFGKGKCKFIANFSATMVTSLPSLSLSLSLSLCLSVSLSLSHQKYLTHNIGSASALPIILPLKNLRIPRLRPFSETPRVVARQECERQKCDRYQCEANSANANCDSQPTIHVKYSVQVQFHLRSYCFVFALLP